MKFYKCNVCGNIVEKIEDGGNTPSCCGRGMMLLEANTNDGYEEKHLPYISRIIDLELLKGIEVQIGAVTHPSIEAHHISWIELETEHGACRHMLTPGEYPVTTFFIPIGESIKGIYCYCNLHGLWFLEYHEED